MHIRNTDSPGMSNAQKSAKCYVTYTNTEGPDFMAKLRQEYKDLVDKLRKQGSRPDPTLLMRLTVVMMDLGLYQPSPP